MHTGGDYLNLSDLPDMHLVKCSKVCSICQTIFKTEKCVCFGGKGGGAASKEVKGNF